MTKMAATDRRTASRVERYAWTFFVFVGVVLVLFGLTDLGAGGATFGQGEAPTFDGITGTPGSRSRVLRWLLKLTGWFAPRRFG